MSLPAQLNFVLNQGDSWTIEFSSSALIGAVIYSELRNENLKLIETFSSSISGNTITLSLTNSETALIKKGNYRYDLRIKRGSNLTTEYRGNIQVV